ncbi:MAG: hypothetical protein M4579_005156 [Chaenotheca gracillima]|nr:MAG: hypothetical protein M4579_005156 [Chaenotheca gracillima]
MVGLSRETTVVRIPLKSAKHHFGVSISRGSRPYNEDAYQAGVIEIPAFARRVPVSLTRSPKASADGEGTSADGASGDPQVFFFGVYDGHGGAECSGFLRERLHRYVEETSKLFELQSSLKQEEQLSFDKTNSNNETVDEKASTGSSPLEESEIDAEDEAEGIAIDSELSEQFRSIQARAVNLERALVRQWNETVGGYFRRFRPRHFDLSARPNNKPSSKETTAVDINEGDEARVNIEAVMTYAFLKADLDFIMAQAGKEEDPVQADRALNDNEILGETSKLQGRPGGQKRFKGGSTCSVAMISTPTPTPFWNPSTPSTLVTSHVGDTRILLCSTETGAAMSLTTNHHPSSPSEGQRLRRYAATFVTDSFGEERMSGLANTRAFGDIQSKRIGVSAEPEMQRLDLKPAEFSFLVLVSDGISGTLNDQEIVDVVKEARTPEQGAKDVVSFATEVSTEGDNATCMVVRLGGWERRSEGGLGAMGTRESRDWRRQEAADPRSRRT